MSNLIAKFVILGPPRVKKNNQRLASRGKYAVRYNTPSYKEWLSKAIPQIYDQKKQLDHIIDYPVNLRCMFYMPTRGRVDLSALYEGIQDLLASKDKYDKNGRLKSIGLYVLDDDNYKIVAGHDGSRVHVDKANPRMEIFITKMEGYDVEATKK